MLLFRNGNIIRNLGYGTGTQNVANVFLNVASHKSIIYGAFTKQINRQCYILILVLLFTKYIR